MKVLLIYPRTPLSFFSYPKLLHYLGCKALIPPLCLLTVAALLPREWRLRLVDLNVEPVPDNLWDWADLVMTSGMLIQRANMLALIREAKARGKTVVVGGTYATSLPEEVLGAGADFVVRGEGENSLPLFLEALAQDQPGGIIHCDTHPDLTASPIPRYDLLNLEKYLFLAVQTSRGCPHDCEFCEVVQLFGRRPRYKEPRQVIAELEAIYRLGWRKRIFICDDNFIGSKIHARAILRELTPWSKSRGEPFVFLTQTTVDLGQDVPLIDEMTEANIVEVFLGIETPEEEALARSHKHHNRRVSMQESIRRIQANGLSIMGSFILGMDGETDCAADRIISLIETTSIPVVMVNLLQPAPHTRLWKRLEQEGRLLIEEMQSATELDSIGTRQFFLPSRPREQIMAEYLKIWETIYEPGAYLARAHRYFLGMRPTRAALARSRGQTSPPQPVPSAPNSRRRRWRHFYTFLLCSWRLALGPSTWRQFWRQLLDLARKNPSRVVSYLILCANGDSMFDWRDLLRQRLAGARQQ